MEITQNGGSFSPPAVGDEQLFNNALAVQTIGNPLAVQNITVKGYKIYDSFNRVKPQIPEFINNVAEEEYVQIINPVKFINDLSLKFSADFKDSNKKFLLEGGEVFRLKSSDGGAGIPQHVASGGVFRNVAVFDPQVNELLTTSYHDIGDIYLDESLDTDNRVELVNLRDELGLALRTSGLDFESILERINGYQLGYDMYNADYNNIRLPDQLLGQHRQAVKQVTMMVLNNINRDLTSGSR